MLDQARQASWARHGKGLTIALPGMFTAYGRRGRHPAVSITGGQCQQMCDHCAGRLIAPMHAAPTPDELVDAGLRLAGRGATGLLLSGGSDQAGRLPWAAMLPAVARLSAKTDLILTAHVGRIDTATAKALKAAGVRQALVDVVGDAATARQVLHLPDGLAAQEETLDALGQAGLEVIPHVILGLHGGQWRGERAALARVARLDPAMVVFVVFMPLKHTPLAQATPLPVLEVAEFLARARLELPQPRHHLGCARPRGAYRAQLDALAVAAGVNTLAIASDGALEAARALGVPVTHRDTCCSLA